MIGQLELKGYWWLPGSDNNKINGILSFSQEEGGLLDLFGIFQNQRKDAEHNPIIILGEILDGTKITLYKCFNKGKFTSLGLGNESYRIQIIFQGALFNTVSEIKFNQLFGYYLDLDSWVDIYGFSFNFKQDDNKLISQINYTVPSNIFYKIDETFEAGIYFSSNGLNDNPPNEINITQKAFLTVKTNQDEVSFFDIFSRLNIFVNLFQIALQRVPSPISIYGFSRSSCKIINGHPIYSNIYIYYQSIEPTVTRKPIFPNEMLFTFKDLTSSMIKKWFRQYEKYRIVINLYRTLFLNDKLFLETKFLNAVQSLETIHGLLFESKMYSRSEFSARKKNILENIPRSYQSYVEDALNSLNYKRLGLRITELLEGKKDIISECITDIELFSSKVKDTRNYLVHHSKQRNVIHDPDELYKTTFLMTIIIEIYLFEIIGFSSDDVKELIEPKIQTYLTGWTHMRMKLK